MKQFTKEQLDILSQWEDRFYTATVSKYYRNISSKSLDLIKSIYDEATESTYYANWSCSHCVLSFLMLAGKKYFEDKKAYEEKAAQLVEAIDAVMAEVQDELEPKVKKHVRKAPSKKPANKATKKK